MADDQVVPEWQEEALQQELEDQFNWVWQQEQEQAALADQVANAPAHVHYLDHEYNYLDMMRARQQYQDMRRIVRRDAERRHPVRYYDRDLHAYQLIPSNINYWRQLAMVRENEDIQPVGGLGPQLSLHARRRFTRGLIDAQRRVRRWARNRFDRRNEYVLRWIGRANDYYYPGRGY